MSSLVAPLLNPGLLEEYSTHAAMTDLLMSDPEEWPRIIACWREFWTLKNEADFLFQAATDLKAGEFHDKAVARIPKLKQQLNSWENYFETRRELYGPKVVEPPRTLDRRPKEKGKGRGRKS